MLHLKQGFTTMLIRPLDDCTYCARSAFTDLELWQKLYDCSQPANVFSNVPYWHFCRRFQSNRLADVGDVGGRGWMGPFDSLLPVGSSYTQRRLSLAAWLQFQKGIFRHIFLASTMCRIAHHANGNLRLAVVSDVFTSMVCTYQSG